MRREIEIFIEFTEQFNYKETESSALSQSRISEFRAVQRQSNEVVFIRMSSKVQVYS